MKRVFVALIAGTVLSGLAAAYATTVQARATGTTPGSTPAPAPETTR